MDESRNDRHDKVLSIRISGELYEALRLASCREERTVSQQVRYLIQEYLEKNQDSFRFTTNR